MKNDLTRPRFDLATVSTADLRAEMAKGLTMTADTLYRLGIIWAELERRGEDLSDLRHGLARTLPLIAAGRLAAEAVVAFANRPAILRALEGVGLDRQRTFAAGSPVEVIDPTDPTGVQSLPLATLPAAAIRLVFDAGEVRTPQAQRLALRPRKKVEKEEYHYRPRYDAVEGTLRVGRMTIKLADLLSELSSGPDRPPALDLPEEVVTIKVRLSKAEAARFTATCRKVELPDWELIRKAMRAFGLI